MAGASGRTAGDAAYERDVARAMADQHPALLWISDETGRCTEFNRAWLEFRGRTTAEERGVGWLDGVHADDRSECLAVYLAHFARRERFEMRYRLQRADGAYRLILDAGGPWYREDGSFAGFVGSCLDITDHTRTARDLARSEALYRGAVAVLHEGVLVTDQAGVVLSVNAAAEALLGAPATDLVGRGWDAITAGLEVFRTDGSPFPITDLPLARALRDGEEVLGTTVGWATGDGPMRWHSVSCRPLRIAGDEPVFALVTSFMDVTEHLRAAQEARHRAEHDVLTGVPNRAGLAQQVAAVLARTPRTGSDVAVAFCDVDNLKVVNDSLGHAAGDALLRTLADRLLGAVRSGDVVARVGGDEFAVVLDAVAGRDGALAAAEKLRAAVRGAIVVDGITVEPTVSVGVTLLTTSDTLEQSLRRADGAMYAAKAAGRDRVMSLDD